MFQDQEGRPNKNIPEEAELLVDRVRLHRTLTLLDPAERQALAPAEGALAALEELFSLAQRIDLGDNGAADQLVGMLGCGIEASHPPGRPPQFTMKAISGGQIGLPFPLPSSRWQFPCFLSPVAFGQLARGIFTFAIQRGELTKASVDDAIWSALWAVFDLYRRLEPLARLHRASLELEYGHTDLAGFRRVAAAAGPCVESAGSAGEALVPLMGTLPIPTLPGVSHWIDPCRMAGWIETERAVRCFCYETYRIEEIRNCTPGRPAVAVACTGECIEIRGNGFGPWREWGVSDRVSDVLFQGDGGRRVAATVFLPLPAEGDPDDGGLPAVPGGWSETRIRVQVPAGAVRGDISLRVLCRHGPTGRPVDPEGCRFPTRLRSLESEPFLEILGTVIAVLSAEHDGTRVEARDSVPEVVEAEACALVALRVEVSNGESVLLRDDTGAEIPLDDISPVPTTVIGTVPLMDGSNRTLTLTVESRCLDAPLTRTLVVRRYFAVHLAPESQRLSSGATAFLQARVSCPLPAGGRIRAVIDNRWTGVALPSGLEQELEIDAGSDRSLLVPVTTQIDLCGTAMIRGELVAGSSEEHRASVAVVHVEAVQLELPISLHSVSVRLSEPIADRDHLSGVRDQVTFTGIFPAGRSELRFTLDETIPIDIVLIQPSPRDIVASYDAATGHFEFTLTGHVGTTLPFIEGSNVSIPMSSRGDLRERWGLFASVGLALGRSQHIDGGMTFYLGRAVGEGELVGGTFGGRRVALSVTFAMASRPLRSCGLEPPFGSADG